MNNFHKYILQWYDQKGRHTLPWRQTNNPYHIWLAEIMLQQTQVQTALTYFLRFLNAFPSLQLLAAAPLSDVLALWSGLGYYARARNLHKTAVMLCESHGGIFPSDVNELIKLPGIGRSTAGAIRAIAFQKRGIILDGNVKRILSRFFALAHPSDTVLWSYAEQLTPHKRVHDYSQAIMDLGAMVCTPKTPRCEECPVKKRCRAHQQGQVALFPVRIKKAPVPVRSVFWIMPINEQKQILLHERQKIGIWGGLWCPLECSTDEDPIKFSEQHLGVLTHVTDTLATFSHKFSHFTLKVTPLLVRIIASSKKLHHTRKELWYDNQRVGLPAPVKKLLLHIQSGSHHDTNN